jgi:predicted nucleotidyltransferase
MVQTKKELYSLLKSNAGIIKNFGVEKLCLFGSFRHDTATPGSDIDFLVDFAPEKKSYKNLYSLYAFLQNLTGREIELVTRQGLSKYIGPHILKDLENVELN